MDRRVHSRRRVLRAGAGLASVGILGGLAGCQNPLGGSSGSSERLDSVPSGSQSVVHVDVAAILDDGALRDSANQLLGEVSAMTGAMNGATSVEGLLDQFEGQAGLDLRNVSELLAFASFSPQPSAAMVAYTDWDEGDLVSAIESQGTASLESSTYGEQTVYTTSGSTSQGSLGVLGDGTYAFGTQSAVHDAIDVDRGEAESVSGTVRSKFETAQSGYVRFATTIPESAVPQGDSGAGTAEAAIRELTSVHGSIGRSGSGRRASVTLEAGSESAAQQIEQLIHSGMAMASQQIQQSASQYAEDVQSIVDATSVSRSGSSVTVEYDGTPRGVVLITLGLFAVVASFMLGLGPGEANTVPTAAFDVDYDSSSGELTVVHSAGDAIPAGNLSIRVDGSSAFWATLADIGEDEPVTAGMQVTMDVESPGTVRVVYTSANTSAVIDEWQGPDA